MFNFEVELELQTSIGKRFKEFRKSRSYTQVGFADKLGIEQYAISKIENGTIPIHSLQLVELAKLGCDLHWLITGERIRNKNDKDLADRISEIVSTYKS